MPVALHRDRPSRPHYGVKQILEAPQFLDHARGHRGGNPIPALFGLPDPPACDPAGDRPIFPGEHPTISKAWQAAQPGRILPPGGDLRIVRRERSPAVSDPMQPRSLRLRPDAAGADGERLILGTLPPCEKWA